MVRAALCQFHRSGSSASGAPLLDARIGQLVDDRCLDVGEPSLYLGDHGILAVELLAKPIVELELGCCLLRYFISQEIRCPPAEVLASKFLAPLLSTEVGRGLFQRRRVAASNPLPQVCILELLVVEVEGAPL